MELDAAAEQLLALLQALQDREKLANPLRQRLVSGLRCDLPELTSRPDVYGMRFRFFCETPKLVPAIAQGMARVVRMHTV